MFILEGSDADRTFASLGRHAGLCSDLLMGQRVRVVSRREINISLTTMRVLFYVYISYFFLSFFVFCFFLTPKKSEDVVIVTNKCTREVSKFTLLRNFLFALHYWTYRSKILFCATLVRYLNTTLLSVSCVC